MAELTVKSKFFAMEDKVDVSDEEVEGLVKPIAEGVVTADKDILSQIAVEYDEAENNSTFTFPKGIIPLSYYCDDYGVTIFFDYDNEIVLDDGNTPVGTISVSPNGVSFTISGDYGTIVDSDSLDYILNNNGLTFTFNSYYFYNPVKPSDIKPIYYHPINILGTYGVENCRFTLAIIDNNPNPYNDATKIKTRIKELIDLGANIQCNGYVVSSSKYYNLFLIVSGGENLYYIFGNSNVDVNTAISLDDISMSVVTDGVNRIN